MLQSAYKRVVRLQAGESSDRFDMIGLRKEIDGLNVEQAVAGRDQRLRITGERGRVAGDVDQGSRRAGDKRCERLRLHARTRRIDDGSIDLGTRGRRLDSADAQINVRKSS